MLSSLLRTALSIPLALAVACSGASIAGDSDQTPAAVDPAVTVAASAAASPASASVNNATSAPELSPSPEQTIATAALPTVAPASTRVASPLLPLASVPQARRAGAMEVTLVILPGRAGFNEVNFYFFDVAGTWILVESAEVRFTFLDFDAATVVEQTAPLHPGHVLVQGGHLRHPGRWRSDARFTGVEIDEATVSFQVQVP
jgi:hypothetical protein